MITLNNKILKTSDGKLIKPYSIPPIELQNEGQYFPNYNGFNYNFIFQFTSSVPNTIYFDFGDGSPIHSVDFTGTFNSNTSLKTYTDDVNIHIVKIWFRIPSKVTSLNWSRVVSRGKFPEAISYYNFDNINITDTIYIQDFNADYPPVYQRRIRLNNVTNNTVVGIPEWILKSRIENVELGGKFDLSNPATNNIDRLIEVKDLKNFAIVLNNGLTNIASNFKDIVTLRGLSFSNSLVTSITPEINACKQLTHLLWGYSPLEFGTTSSRPKLTSWGSGLYGMTNLIYFGVGVDSELNMPSTLPNGIEECIKIKTLYFAGSLNNQTKVDAFVTDIYTRLSPLASMSIGNTQFRQISLQIGRLNTSLNKRPSGVYQAPIGFVLGSSNGTPASPMEMLYVLKKQYAWTITVENEAGTGNESLP